MEAATSQRVNHPSQALRTSMTALLTSRTARGVAAAAAWLAWPLAHAQGGGDNPYGVGALWQQSDVVARSVLLILAAMSAGSWYVIVTKLLEQLRVRGHAKGAASDFWDAGTVQAGAGRLHEASPFREIAEAGLDATRRHGGLHARVDFNDWVDLTLHRATERVQRRLAVGLSFLATVGSTSPFVGLFGTVWGIYHALTAIGLAGQASIDKVAGPVGEALIMTALGLAVAVPAVLGYNFLLRRNSAVLDDVRDFSGELHAVLLGAGAAAPHANAGVGAAAAAAVA
jgi:biopolymer transport protein ExbB